MIFIDWNAIRAEYIAGASYRDLADKYSVSKDMIARKGKAQGWSKDRQKASDATATKVIQAAATKAADNASLAADVKRTLLLRIRRTEAKFPMDATEVKATENGKTVIYRLRDLTAAYRDITADMFTGEQANNELLQSLMELERR